MPASSTPATPDSMADYYARRVASYEQVYLKPERQADLREIEAGLPEPFAGRRVLEIACGTGWWTPHGAARAAHWRATDLNPETLVAARSKPLPAGVVQFQTVDAYRLTELGGEMPGQLDQARLSGTIVKRTLLRSIGLQARIGRDRSIHRCNVDDAGAA